MAEPGKKRNRSSNFSVFETECLINEVLKRISIIENRRTDTKIWKEKEECWNDLTNSFNRSTGGCRTVKMLKNKYDGVKRGIKGKYAMLKSENFKTGAFHPTEIKICDWEERLMSTISLIAEGLPPLHDSDAPIKIENIQNDIQIGQSAMYAMPMIQEDSEAHLPNTSTNIMQDQNSFGSDAEESSKDNSWASWQPKQYETPISKKLQTKSNSVQEKYSAMSDTRMELMAIQKQIAEQELLKIAQDMRNTAELHAEQLSKIRLEMEHMRNEEIRKQELHDLQIKYFTERINRMPDKNK